MPINCSIRGREDANDLRMNFTIKLGKKIERTYMQQFCLVFCNIESQRMNGVSEMKVPPCPSRTRYMEPPIHRAIPRGLCHSCQMILNLRRVAVKEGHWVHTLDRGGYRLGWGRSTYGGEHLVLRDSQENGPMARSSGVPGHPE